MHSVTEHLPCANRRIEEMCPVLEEFNHCKRQSTSWNTRKNKGNTRVTRALWIKREDR